MRRGELPASGKWFVGRVGELAAIGACVDAVSGGAGQLVSVEGVQARVRQRSSAMWWPSSRLVLWCCRLRRTSRRPISRSPVLEQLGIEGGGSALAAGLDLVALLTEAGGRGPVAVVAEDLHWADRESRQALLTVVRRVGEERVLLLVTSRPGAAADGCERLLLDPSASLRVVLGALSRDDVDEMAGITGLALPWRAVGQAAPAQAAALRCMSGPC